MPRHASRRGRRDRSVEWLVAGAAGFLVGAFVMALLTVGPGRGFFDRDGRRARPAAAEAVAEAEADAPVTPDIPVVAPAPSGAGAPGEVARVTRLRPAAGAAGDLRGRGFRMPVAGVSPEALVPSFDDPRGSNRRHEAIDILAPRGTDVLAVEDGTIARLFTSDAGGLTVYQYDPSGAYVYYYAHLDRYADGLAEGDRIRAGQRIGHVGTTGNAPADVPHLHFAIMRLDEPGRWWDGTAVDPYPLLRTALPR